ncbi:MAG: rRNA pseudouridine synthase [Oscillospiraceae bacterium]|nr:rRNA pseudouridine synthase [Oscillospiraceae bacterium]
MDQRLQKIIAASGLMARRKAEELIAAGRVTVNGCVARLGDSADPDTDEILVDGRRLSSTEQKVYIMLNKPRGIVTSLHDEKGRRDLSGLIREIPERVYPVGRLDLDSEGLLLLTNDGDLAQRLMHPSFEIEKVYRTWVRGDEIAARAERLRRPMEIDGCPVGPAKVEIREQSEGGAVLDVTIHEGRNRQVRKMCQQAGLTVTRLCRIREGGLSLGGLRPGQWRELTEAELRSLEVGP